MKPLGLTGCRRLLGCPQVIGFLFGGSRGCHASQGNDEFTPDTIRSLFTNAAQWMGWTAPLLREKRQRWRYPDQPQRRVYRERG